MTYEKQENDVQYRFVDLYKSVQGDFLPFCEETLYIPNHTVLEVCHSDNSTSLIYENERELVHVSRYGSNQLYFSSNVQPARLWIRLKGGSDTAYKVPMHPPIHDGNYYIYIPGGAQDVELYGDRYFEAAYDIRIM